jgi:F-type H+-transporting ATPase subunit delta
MRSTLLADRYAQALKSAVTDAAQLQKAAESLNTLGMLYAGDAVFRGAMLNPVLDRSVRRQVLDTALKKLEASAEMTLLLHTLLDRNRMALLPALANRFQDHLNEWMNCVEVTVVTAGPLTPEFEHRITAAMERFSGKTVQLNCKVDPGVIGGLVVHILGNFIDFSLRTRLERLKEKLLSEETLTYGY